MEFMTTIKKGIFVGVLASFSVISIAEEQQKAAGSGPNPFSDCGIGAALFPTVGWAAALSNVIWDAGTTAVTSATASPETCNGKEVETAQFILENYDNLAEETARGQGEHLTAMLGLMGCAADTHSTLVTEIRTDMADAVNQESFSEQSAVNKASEYYQAVSNAVNAMPVSSCSA